MGFCRRCGDIVVGPRCKCGGSAVAPVVRWDQNDGKPQDRWSKTYVTREQSPTRPVRETVDDTPPSTSTSSSRRFPRPTPTSSITLGTRVSAHIANATAPRPPSPLKHSSSISSIESSSAAAAAGILPNLTSNGSVLAKVYGSVLQPKETLDSFHCAICSTTFPPDATIYPDPSTLSSTGLALTAGDNTRFLCRPCFVDNGGSKGDCPACFRPVLILKTEGGFVENGGRVWHRKCFQCDGCGRDIGDAPMVDLLGKPCCADCFDTCLTRSNKNTPQKSGRRDDGPSSNLGGTRRGEREREGSPALEELEQRLGIVRSRESTPAQDERSFRSPTSLKSPTLTPVRAPLVSRYTPGNSGSVDNSPIAERLAARVRADSFPSIGSSPAMQSTASQRAYNRFKSPEPEIFDRDSSPLSSRRLSRYRSPEPEDALSDDSPTTRRTYNRFRSPEPDVFGSSPISRTTGSPRYSSPSATSRQPTEEAIEEMKQRFLRQASPSPARGHTTPKTSAETMTARRRSRSRARSSVADENGVLRPSFTGTTTGADVEIVSRIPRKSGTPSLRKSPSTGSLQTSVRGDKTGETDYTLRRDRTGDDEVESLLGEKVPTGNLVDVSTSSQENDDDWPRSKSTGPMSDIPTPLDTSRDSEEMDLGTIKGLGIRTTSSRTDLHSVFDQSMPSTPDLGSEFSDTTSTTHSSSAPSTPPSLSPPSRRTSNYVYSSSKYDVTPTIKSQTIGGGGRRSRASDAFSNTTPTPKSKTLPSGINVPSPTPLSPEVRCAKCNLPLFTTKYGGKFVTVPEEPSSSGVPPKTYHTACFRCKVCDGAFEEREGGRAVFVRGQDGACHVECAPPEKVKVHRFSSSIPKPTFPTSTSTTPLSTSRAQNTSSYSTREPTSSSRYERPPPSAPAATTSFTFPKFGGGVSCPGCNLSVSPMERGVVPGPQGTRWHANCLLCGGKEAKGRRREEGKPGCGKNLDSAAKTDCDGRVWCRECLLLLPASMRNPSSPTRSPVMPSHTGNRGVAPQHTGTTTIARQFTGLGGSDAAMMRQLTGGGLSPTRQLSSSPTKLYDGPRPGARYPRPKSVTGIRSTKSEGEGRGMFLVRQLTGGK